MSTPTLVVEIAFTSNPLTATPAWVAVTADVRERVSIRRGRQTERDRIEAGTATLTLDNRTRKYDPNNSGSPYNGYILPMRLIRIGAVFGGITYWLYRGYVVAWTPVEPGGQDAVVRLNCVDAFKFFSLAPMTLIRPQELGSARISAILTALGWPPGDTTISVAQSTLQALLSPGTRAAALQHMQDVAASENGQLFMGAAGDVVFQDRHYRLKNSTLATFGTATGGSEIPFLDIGIGYDDTQIWNEIEVSYTGGSTVTASNAASQAAYFRRTLSASRPYIMTSGEALDHASWMLLRYATPDIRIDRLVLNGHLSDTVWPHQLGREISDRITVVHRPPGGGAAIRRELYIESVQHDIPIRDEPWTTTWSLSSANTLNLLVLDVGRLDYDALAY